MTDIVIRQMKYYLPRNHLENENSWHSLRKKGLKTTKNWLFRLIKLANYYIYALKKSNQGNIYRFSLDSRYHNFKIEKAIQLSHFLQSQKNLHKLFFSFETNQLTRDSIDDQGLKVISSALLNLQKLNSCNMNLKRCSNISNLGLCKFFRNISFCKKLETLDLDIGVNQRLNQTGLKIVSKSLSKLRLLKNLALNLSFTGLKNQSLQELIKGATVNECLTSLDLQIESCHDLESQGFAAMFQTVNSLNKIQIFKLNMKGCSKIEENEIMLMFGILSSVDQLKYLNVNMTWCNLRRLQLPGIVNNPKGFINLRSLELNFRGCMKIEKSEISTLEVEAKLLPRIQTISIFSY